MTPRRPTVRLALAAFAVAASLALPAPVLAQEDAAASNGPAAGGIGVVDMERVFNNTEATKQLRAQGEQLQGQLEQELTALQGEVEELQASLAELDQQSDQAQELRARAGQKAFELQFRSQYANVQLSNFRKQANLAVYGAVRQAAAEVARERGLSVVIQKSRSIPQQVIQQGSDNDLSQAIQQQTTLYVSPGADITGEVIAKMDAQVNSGQSPEVTDLPPAELDADSNGDAAE